MRSTDPWVVRPMKKIGITKFFCLTQDALKDRLRVLIFSSQSNFSEKPIDSIVSCIRPGSESKRSVKLLFLLVDENLTNASFFSGVTFLVFFISID
ncbi:hypothetical protein [Holospora curviuscula]|uniref:Uncharacterized protein n=1 Tax=Holospora curviuscula TaxID=1082868 RepID=A0A2S5R7J0_9PROT|nr:hypothetical protein [Holospora curviuscula]PPE03270.1 hypothetical protein HCUR_01291 [Holospora curviuscula]